MKVPSSNQSLILAHEYRGPRPKAESVFDAALGPASGRATPQRLTIVAAHLDTSTVEEASDDESSVGGQAAGAQTQVAMLSDASATHAAKFLAARSVNGTAQFRHPIDLYEQTQGILTARSSRSVYLDVQA